MKSINEMAGRARPSERNLGAVSDGHRPRHHRVDIIIACLRHDERAEMINEIVAGSSTFNATVVF